MKTVPLYFCALLALLTACGKKESSNVTDTNFSSGNPITAPVDYLGAINKAQKHAVKTIDLASVQNAINLFTAQEDRLPKSLDELVQKRYLGQIPPAPAGQTLVYDPKTGQVKMVKQ